MPKKLPQSINFLEPVTPPDDFWTGVYDWVFDIGKYLLVGVQLIVLVVFFSRFIFDRTNNDLSDTINEQVETLEKPFFRDGEIRYYNLQDLTYDISQSREEQDSYSSDIGGVINAIPTELKLKSFTFAEDSISISLESIDLESVREYEKQLEDNPLYTDIKVSLTKSGGSSEVDFNVIFKIVANVIEE